MFTRYRKKKPQRTDDTDEEDEDDRPLSYILDEIPLSQLLIRIKKAETQLKAEQIVNTIDKKPVAKKQARQNGEFHMSLRSQTKPK